MNSKIKIKTLLLVLTAVFTISYTVIFPERMTKSSYLAIKRCIEIVVPSLLFPMCISQIILKTGIYKLLCFPFRFVFRLLRLSDEEISVFIMANISGYPIGALMISQLYTEKIVTKSDAERMLTFCYAPSPSFVISLVGVIVFKNKNIGVLIYLSNLIVNFILLLFYSLTQKIQRINTEITGIKINPEEISDCIYSSAQKLVKMCSIILVISVLLDFVILLIEGFSFDINLIKCIFEISYIAEIKRDYNILFIIAALFSFGGFSVLIQLKTLCKGISLNMFLKSRIYVFVMNMVTSYILFHIFDEKVYLTSVFAYTRLVKNNNYLSTICVLFMIIIFFLKKPLVKSERTCYNIKND